MDNKKTINDWEECPICGNEVYLVSVKAYYM